jgi:hypothetical protein
MMQPVFLAADRASEARLRDDEDLLDLARTCFKQARWTTDPMVADKFRVMAREYFERAKRLNPDLSEDDLK